MRFSRRRFVMGSVLLGCLTLVGRLRGQAASLSDLEGVLEAWVETLFPSDEFGPGAGRLGVHVQILEKASSRKPYLQLLGIGSRWANAEAVKLGASCFAELNSEQAESVVALADSMGLQSMPGLFFYHTLKDAKGFYYFHQEAWQGVGMRHAPQPLGFMDYTEVPK